MPDPHGLDPDPPDIAPGRHGMGFALLAGMEQTNKQATDMSTPARFNEYIHVVNQAIGQNRDKFPYSTLIEAGKRLYGDAEIGVAVYASDPKNPHDYFTLRLTGDTFDVASHGKSDDVGIAWKMADEHINHVISNPEAYKERPGRLDLDWLMTRLGFSVVGKDDGKTRTEAGANTN